MEGKLEKLRDMIDTIGKEKVDKIECQSKRKGSNISIDNIRETMKDIYESVASLNAFKDNIEKKY